MPLLFHSRKTVRVAGLLAGLLQDMLSQVAQDASERHDGRRAAGSSASYVERQALSAERQLE